MKFIEDTFGRPALKLSLDDVRNFFATEPREGQHLEFKSGEVAIAKLQKETCAFLNSEGGLLILGAPRESGGIGTALDLSSLDNANLLRQEIIRGIVPTPEGIKSHRIEGDAGNVFLIEIPASPLSPHQLPGSGQYYVRQGAISRPAMHQEVEEMFLSKRRASLSLQIEIERPDDALLARLIIGNKSQVSAYEPGFNFIAYPARNAPQGRFALQNLATENYLAEDQNWLQELSFYPSESRFFMHCQYYCRDVPPKTKAAFAEIHNNKVELLSVYNSEVHPDYDHWYQENLYLLND